MTLRVAMVSDPGLPDRYDSSFLDSLDTDLQDALGEPVELHQHTKALLLTGDGSLALGETTELARSESSADLIFVITEVPRYHGHSPLLAEVHPADRVVVISYPSLGVFRRARRLRRVLISSASIAFDRERDESPVPVAAWCQPDSEGETVKLAASHRYWSNARMAIGMAMTNDPFHTLLKLSSALAGAAAAGGFGIFYNSIWQMASALSPQRLLLIGVLAIVAMVAWLVISNRLWETSSRPGLKSATSVYNASTLITLTLCVTGLYLTLMVLVLVGGLVVIDPGFMTQVLGQPASFENYFDIAWLSAAMGLVAGALGSSFDNDLDIRRLTNGQREWQRYLERDES